MKDNITHLNYILQKLKIISLKLKIKIKSLNIFKIIINLNYSINLLLQWHKMVFILIFQHIFKVKVLITKILLIKYVVWIRELKHFKLYILMMENITNMDVMLWLKCLIKYIIYKDYNHCMIKWLKIKGKQ